MTTVWIDNGKSPDEPYNASLGFWLPPDTPYGNFGLKLMKLCDRIDKANRDSVGCSSSPRSSGSPPPGGLGEARLPLSTLSEFPASPL